VISINEEDFRRRLAGYGSPAKAADQLYSGALCWSIRVRLEPVKITIAKLRRRQAQYREDIKGAVSRKEV